MGNICCDKSNKLEQKFPNSSIKTTRNKTKGNKLVNENTEQNNVNNDELDALDKIFCSSMEEFKFWMNLHELGLTKITSIDKQNLIIHFDYSEIYAEDIFTFTKLVSIFESNENLFFFPKLLEVIPCIIDFIQCVLHLKQRHKIKDFFLIYFDSFFFEKINNEYHLKYCNTKLNEAYLDKDLYFKSDNLISSISILENSNIFAFNKQNNNTNNVGKEKRSNTANKQIFNSKYSFGENNNNSNNISDTNSNYKGKISIDEPEFNSHFYYKSNIIYQEYIIRKNFDFDEIEYFYSEVIMNFINRFLFKKVNSKNFGDSIESDLKSLKSTVRSCFKELRKEKMQLSKLKEFIMSILYNNNEMCNLVNKLNSLLFRTDTSDFISDKIIYFKKIGFNFSYGNCANKDSSSNISQVDFNSSLINLNTSQIHDISRLSTNKNNSYNNIIIDEQKLRTPTPYLKYKLSHIHCFVYDSIIEDVRKNSSKEIYEVNIKDNFCICCAWDLFIDKKIKTNEKICLKELESLILSSKSKSVKSTIIDLFYYLKYICFLQPLCIDFNPRKSELDNSNNISTISVAKNNLGIKEFSDLLSMKKDKIFLIKSSTNLTICFEYVYLDNEYNEFLDVINFDVKLQEIINNQYKKTENSMIYFADDIRSSKNNNSQIRFSVGSEKD